MQQSMSLSFVVVVADATVDALKYRWQKGTIIETDTEIETEIETEIQTEFQTDIETEIQTEIQTEIETEIQTGIETESDLYGWFFTPNDAPHL